MPVGSITPRHHSPRTPLRHVLLGLFGLAALTACGGGGNPPNDGGGDAARVDLGFGLDSGPGVDLGPPGCRLSEAVDVEEDAAGGEIVPAFAAGNADRLIVYRSDVEGQTALRARIVMGDGTLGVETEVMVATAGEVLERPAAVRTDTGWLVAWDQRAGAGAPPTVMGRRLSPDGTVDASPAGAAKALAESGATGIAMAPVRDRVYAAYLDATGTVRHRVYDADGEPVTEPVVVHDASGEALEAMEARIVPLSGSTEGSYVGFALSDGSVWGRRIRLSGEAAAAAGMLSDGSSVPTGRFALGYSGVVVGAVYTHAPQGVPRARVRTISETGVIGMRIEPLPSGTAEVRAYGVARYAAGLAVVYRTASPGRNELNLALVDIEGIPVFDTRLGSVFASDGWVDVVQARDGTLGVAWVDETLSGARLLRTATLTCVAPN